MDKDIQTVYENYFDLFGSVGWKQLCFDLQETRKDFDQVLSCKDEKELYQRQGQLIMLDRILNMPDMMEYAYQQAKEAESDA
jgi:hypothetical protein